MGWHQSTGPKTVAYPGNHIPLVLWAPNGPAAETVNATSGVRGTRRRRQGCRPHLCGLTAFLRRRRMQNQFTDARGSQRGRFTMSTTDETDGRG